MCNNHKKRCSVSLVTVIFVVQSLSHIQLFVTSWAIACQAPLSSTISQSLFRHMPIKSVMLTNHLILHSTFLLLPSIFPNIRAFCNELAIQIRWQKNWSFSFSNSPSNEYSELISFSPMESQESSTAPQFKSINSLAFRLLYGLTLTSVHDYWETHSFDYTDLCQQSDVSAF